MAEFMNQKRTQPLDPFLNMGRPIPMLRRQIAYEHCQEMGCDSATSWECVNGVAEMLERDKPYEAMAAGMVYLDLTGTYRIMAVLLTGPTTDKETSP